MAQFKQMGERPKVVRFVRLGWLAISVALGMIAGANAAHAGPPGCGFEPLLNRSNGSIATELLTTVTSMNANAEQRACAAYGLGTLYAFEGKNDKALDAYKKALAWTPSNADPYEGEGDAYTALGQADLAAKAYAQAASATQDRPAAAANRCWTRAIRGQALDRAVNDCTAALKDRPDWWDAMVARALAYERMGKHDEAIADCNDVLTNRPRNADALFIRGLAETAKGNASGAADLAAAKDADYRIAEKMALYGVKAP